MARHINLAQYPLVIQLAAHAIGLDHKRPYMRHGKTFYRAYRNYFTTHDDAQDYTVWMGLCENGYAKRWPGGGRGIYTFHLTNAGLAWLGKSLSIIIQTKET